MKTQIYILVCFLAAGSFYLALTDARYRDTFAGFAQTGLGAFFGQMIPGKNND